MQAEGDPSVEAIWNLFRTETSRLVDELGDVLGRHLRDRPLELRQVSRPAAREVTELRVGHTILRLECSPACVAPDRDEARLAEIFGATTPLARIHVYRDAASPTLYSWLAADPVTGRWASGHPDLGPATLADSAELENYFWSLLTDVAR